MRGIKLLILFAIFLLFAIPSAQAHEYEKDDKALLLFPETTFSSPHDPKVACHPAGYHCLALVYENNTFYGRGIKVWYTTDFFKTVWGRTQITSISKDYSSWIFGYYDNYHLPYDVTYTNGKYYFFVESTMYSFDGSSVTTVGTLKGNQDGKRWGMAWLDGETTHKGKILSIEAFNIAGISETFSRLKTTILGSSAFTLKATWGGSNNLHLTSNWYNTTNAGIILSSICTSTTSCQFNSSGLTTYFPSDYTGLDYWDGSSVHYQRGNNASWKVETSDLINYGTPEVVYDWYTIGGEYLNNTDSSITDKNRIYMYRRMDGNPSYDGVWIYNLPLTRLKVWGEGYDIENKATDIVNLTVTVNCEDEDYSSTSSGLYNDVETPCQYNNEILINSFTYQPNLVRLPSFNISNNCMGITNYIRTTVGKGFYKPYDFTITIRDEFFGTVVSGVTVSLDGDEETTDVTGKAIFEDIFPISSPNMTIGSYQDYPYCTQYYTFTGAEKTHSLIASKSGYEIETRTFKIANAPFDVDTDFISEKTFYLTPENTRVEVFVYSLDGIELSPAFTTVTLTGSNDTYWVFNNEWFHQNSATSVPALFYLLNNTGTFDVNISLDYFEEYNITEEVTVGSYHEVKIYLNYSSWELPCYSDGDCPNILCIGKFYKELKGCVSNQCTYRTIDCGSSTYCDENIGCVDLVSLTNCTKDQDCVNYCLNNYTMVDYNCGYDNYCKGNYIDCPEQCNQTLGYCQQYATCVLGDTQEFKIGFYREGNFVGLDTEFTCGFSNVNSDTCYNVDGYAIPESTLTFWGLTFNDVLARPKGWVAQFEVEQNEQILVFRPVSIHCSELCEMTWEYCEHGCSEGICTGLETITDDTYGLGTLSFDIWTGLVTAYNTVVFPDIHSRSFMWFIYAVIIYLSLWWIKMKALPKRVTQISMGSHHEGDIIMFIIWFAIGSVFGQFYWFIWFGVTVLAVYLFANYWYGRKDR